MAGRLQEKGAAAARELPNLPLEDALQLVDLYAERGSPKYEKAAMRWLERDLSEENAEASALRGDHGELGEARPLNGREVKASDRS